MSNQKSSGSNFQSLFAAIVIPVEIVIAVCIFMFVLGDPANFAGGNVEKGHPENTLGIVYKGGFIVPILISVLMIVITFSIERFITLSRAKGKGSLDRFVKSVKTMVDEAQLDAAIAECDKQRGSVANIIRSGLSKYKTVEHDPSMDKEGKIAAIQKEIEEATSLELPMLSKNLVIISTCASIGTLIGLIGTVLGMIRSFSAMSGASPDTGALATGISEALINTAIGIISSTIAIIVYNYFNTKIDSLTYASDEAGFSILQTFNQKHKA